MDRNIRLPVAAISGSGKDRRNGRKVKMADGWKNICETQGVSVKLVCGNCRVANIVCDRCQKEIGIGEKIFCFSTGYTHMCNSCFEKYKKERIKVGDTFN